MQNSQQKILFVINPVSGGKQKTDWEVTIREFFKDSPLQIEFYMLTGNSDTTSVKHHIETIAPGKVVAVGGDGTVKMVAELIKETEILLGILPAGSANGLAKELGIPLTIQDAVEVIINGRTKEIDAILINDKELCIHLSDIGLNAMLVKYFEGSKKRGMWGYGKSILRVVWTKQKIHATISTDESTVKRKAFMVVLANARKYGTGGNINPEGDISDGYFEVVVLRKLNLIEIVKGLLTDKSFHPRRIEVLKTKKAELTTLKKTYFQVDGEYIGKVNRLTGSILPSAIKVLVPKAEQ